MNQNELIKLAALADAALLENKIEEARTAAAKLINANRSAGLAYQGVIALREEKYDLAEELLLESFQLNGKQNLALANLIPTYLKKKDFKKAIAFGEQAYAVMPKNQSVCINFAAALLQDQGYTKALEVLTPHLDKNNPNISILSGIISCYRSLFMKDESEELIALAEKFFPTNSDVMRLRGDLLAEKSPKEALDAFAAALEKDPKSIATRWNMSLVQLRLGDFSDGWKNYDCGLLPEVGKIGRPLPKLFEGAELIYDTEKLDPDKWTFAICEQGIGDQVLFLGVIQQFLNDYPKTILLAEKRFQPILIRSFPNLPVYIYGAGPLLAANSKICNGYIPIGSIQKKYRTSKDDYLKNRSNYLTPDPVKVQKFREILLKKTGAKKIVGFSWKGGFWERSQRTKTIDIELWDPIFNNPDVIFVSLQYGDTQKEKDYLATKFKNIRWIDGLDFKKDIDGWFALMCACDDIISVSTALVHFAGAAGKSVHLLLSDKGAPFIWGLEDEQSFAYTNIKIYRKKPEQDSDIFFKDVAQKALGSSNEIV